MRSSSTTHSTSTPGSHPERTGRSSPAPRFSARSSSCWTSSPRVPSWSATRRRTTLLERRRSGSALSCSIARGSTGGRTPSRRSSLFPRCSGSRTMARRRAQLQLVQRPELELSLERPLNPLIWSLGLGAFGLAWSITTVAAYLPPVLEQFTDSSTLIGLVLAAEGVFAFFLPLLVGPMSDATQTSLGRRRPYMLLALVPMGAALAAVAFMGSLEATAVALFAFFFAYYLYEPPYRGLYPDCLPAGQFGRAQGVQHLFRGAALGGALVGGGFP